MNLEEYLGKPWYKEPFFIGTALVFLLLFSLFVYTIYVDSHSSKLSYETSFNGEIDDIFNQRSTLYIHLSNQEQWIQLKDFRNTSYPELGFNFMDIVCKGDLFYKHENSDSVYLERNGNKYSFKLEKINVKFKRLDELDSFNGLIIGIYSDGDSIYTVLDQANLKFVIIPNQTNNQGVELKSILREGDSISYNAPLNKIEIVNKDTIIELTP